MLSVIQGIDDLCMTTNGTLLAAVAPALKEAGLNRVNISLDTLDPERYRLITGGGRLDEAMAGIDAALASDLGPIKINMVIFADTAQHEIDTMEKYCECKGLTLQRINHFTLENRDHGPGAVSADRPPKCSSCNKLRLTSDGYLKPCLFSEDEIPVDFDDIRSSLLSAVSGKPVSGTRCRSRLMHSIGG